MNEIRTYKIVMVALLLGMTSMSLGAADTWTQKADMPTGRLWHTSSVVDGKIYAIGRVRAAYASPLSIVEEYDPATDTWTTKTDIPEPRGLLSASAVGGKIYAIGGKATTKDPHPPGLSTVYEYDPNPLVVDFNGDGVVDCVDMCMMVDHWLTDDPLYDIAPELFVLMWQGDNSH